MTAKPLSFLTGVFVPSGNLSVLSISLQVHKLFVSLFCTLTWRQVPGTHAEAKLGILSRKGLHCCSCGRAGSKEGEIRMDRSP